MASREYTPDEVREKFLKMIWGYVGYWENESRAETSQAKLEGLAHSLLALIDGSNCSMPAFILAPLPHVTDKKYNQEDGKNFFPYNERDKKTGSPTKVKADIGGRLANELFRVKERMDSAKKQ